MLAVFVPLIAAIVVTGWVVISAQLAINKAGGGGNVTDVINPKPLNGEAKGSVNILLAGNSFDDTGHDGADLTDSVMVAHLDLHSKKVSLISIPRDLLVTYQGKTMKLNEVYVAAGKGQAGLVELGKVTEQITGLGTDEHMLVGYGALRDAVDAVGGIDVTIKASDKRGIFDPRAKLTITNGAHHIDGTTALALCRARNDPDPKGQIPYGLSRGDFDRQQNQRMVLTALVTTVKDSAALANPLTVVKIFNSIGKYMTTDLTVSQIARLHQLTGDLAGMNSISINGDGAATLLADYTSPAAGASLIPAAGQGNYSVIKAYIAKKISA